MSVKLLIASYLEPEFVDRIREVDDRVEVTYEPTMMAKPRYLADHKGYPFDRSAEDEEKWLKYLAEADIIYDFDQTHLDDFPELAKNAKWLQTTSSGVDRFLSDKDYYNRMPNTVFSNAAGIHAQPLAEFCFMAMTLFNKGFLDVLGMQRAKKWERYAGKDLSNRTLAIVGLGKVGEEVARLAKEHRMKTIGVKRKVEGVNPEDLFVDELYTPDQLNQVLPKAEYVVLIAPHTPETEDMMGATEFALMPKGSVIINIGRGALIDEPALIDALNSGHIAGAALDVFKTEPLPADSPFWDMPNVIVSPHSASTTDNENGLLTDLFCENLKRFIAGEKLINQL